MEMKNIVSQNEVIVFLEDQMLISYIDSFYKVYFQVNDDDDYEYTQTFQQKDYIPNGITDSLFHINTIKVGAITLAKRANKMVAAILAKKINKGEIEL